MNRGKTLYFRYTLFPFLFCSGPLLQSRICGVQVRPFEVPFSGMVAASTVFSWTDLEVSHVSRA